MENPNKRRVTIHKNASSKETATITMERLFKYIQEGRWRHWVDRIRQALAKGDKKEADRLKKKLPYVCFSGLFRDGSHAAECLTDYSSFIVIDYDNVPPEELEQLKKKAMWSDFTLMVFITPSGCGLKVVALTNATREHHAQAYIMLTNHYDHLLSLRHDGSCKDVSRGHFGSYDYNALYNEYAVPFDVESFIDITPTQDEVDAPDGTLMQQEQDASDSTSTPGGTQDAQTSPDPEGAPYHKLHPGITGDEFVLVALALFPAAEGNRNTRLFRIACAARDRGITAQEIVLGAIEHMADATFDAGEITNVVKSAYSRKRTQTPPKQGEKTAANCQTTDPLPLYSKTRTIEHDEEDEKPDGEELREHTLHFPESVYDQLPEFLSTALKYVSGKREPDMLLLAILTVISALIPTVNGFYGHRRMYAYFYTFVIAPAASGKGVMDYALALCKYFLKEISDENDRLEKKYNEECEAYEKHCRTRKKDTPDMSRPEPPVYCYLHIPATVSKSRFLMHLRDNKERGGFIFDLEADTLTSAGKMEYGNYFDFLRKISQHETIGDSFKVNGKPNYVHCPKLAMLLAGTPAQLCRLIANPEDGLYSRFLYYTHRQQAVWRDVSPCDDEEEVERHFDALSMRLHHMLRFLAASPTRVTLSKAQWKRLNTIFSDLLTQEGISDRDDFQSTIKRYSLTTFRICMVLTALEKATLRMDVKEAVCSDHNFETSLSIVTTCLEHSRLLITSLPKADKEVRELQNPNKMLSVFGSLPSTFTLAEYLETTVLFQIQERSAYRALKKAIGLTIKKIKKGLYKKMSI